MHIHIRIYNLTAYCLQYTHYEGIDYDVISFSAISDAYLIKFIGPERVLFFCLNNSIIVVKISLDCVSLMQYLIFMMF